MTVRYEDGRGVVRLVVEGALPAATVGAMVEDLRAKLERLEGVACTGRRVR